VPESAPFSPAFSSLLSFHHHGCSLDTPNPLFTFLLLSPHFAFSLPILASFSLLAYSIHPDLLSY
jgi:hypothetical protein